MSPRASNNLSAKRLRARYRLFNLLVPLCALTQLSQSALSLFTVQVGKIVETRKKKKYILKESN